MKFEKAFELLRNINSVISKTDRHKYTVENLKIGSYIKLHGNLCIVENIHTYSAGNEEWYEIELYSIITSETIYIEYEIDDKIEIYQTIESFNVKELSLSMDDIEKISDNEKGSVKFKNSVFYYEDDYKAKFYRTADKKKDTSNTRSVQERSSQKAERSEGENLYMYEFATEKEDLFLTIEEWGYEDVGYEYKGYLSKELKSTEIEVLSV